ncbi:FAD-dependent oxidoreductase [Hymenobacter terricola]|uniref:FAD-dependent oxidoreductase n=1 Tax=Hymenobacter terricola TaxID=2819236 RepID=UPI001B317099|nr:cyclic nucleotide-binding domain-containing thioredoxin-disulfide reductase [Hymenobacter terricola]
MITLDTLRPLALFADLNESQRAFVVTHAAELVLNAGDYILYEGEEPAFFYILAGSIESTKHSYSQQQFVSTRTADDYLGEVSILMGTPASISARATEPSRVLRLDAHDLRWLMADQPAFAQTIMAEMVRHVIPLQQAALAVLTSYVTLAGHPWDPAAYRMRDFLSRNNILFNWENLDAEIETPAAAPTNRPLQKQSFYARLNDGTVLTNPTVRELAVQLGIRTGPADRPYDLAIVGAGPAGLSAAVYAASEGLATLLIEQEAPGGQAGTSSRIENYLGFPTGISGEDLGRRAFNQAVRLGADIVTTRSAVAFRAGQGHHELVLDGDEVVRARAVVLATGVDWRRLAVPDIDRFLGCGVYYGAARTEALRVQGQSVFLIGGGNSAGQAALFFSSYARQVTVLLRKADLRGTMSQYLIDQLATKPNIRIDGHCEVVAVEGRQHLEAITVLNHHTQEQTRYPTSALFVCIGADARTQWLPDTVARDALGYVLTGASVRTRTEAPRWTLARDPYFLETSVPGLFAAGDVRAGSVKRVAAGVGEGGVVVSFIHAYLGSTLSTLPVVH